LRQFADDVSIIDAGVSSAESIAQIQVVGGGVSTTSIGIVEILQIESNISDLSVENRLTEILQIVDDVDSIQSITSENINIIKLDFTVSFVSDNISLFHQNILETGINNISVSTIQQIIPSVEKFYKTGFIDYYIETILFTNPILQRNGNTVVLEYPENQVYQRNSNIVLVNNSLEDYPEQYSSYTLGNIGNNLYMTNNWYTLDDGTSNVSGLTFDEIIINYNQFTIEDFTEKNLSSISKSRFVWNLTYPSIQNPVTISSSNGNIGSTINVQNATNFPSSGYFYHTNGTSYGVIQYTGKTATTFTGCTVYSGSTTITNTSQIIPYSI